MPHGTQILRGPGGGVAVAAVAALAAISLPAAAQTPDSGPVELAHVEELAREFSPDFLRLQSRYEGAVQAAFGLERPYNPVLGWDAGFLDEMGGGVWEHVVFLEQRFRLPGFGSRLGSLAEGQRREALLARDRDQAVWLAEARHAFVRTALAQAEARSLAQLDSLVELLRGAARARADQGEMAGWELRLLEMGEYQIRSLRAERLSEERSRRALWLGLMGLGEVGELVFDPHRARERLAVPSETQLLSWIDQGPALRAAQQEVEVARRGLALEESRRWSEFALVGGYRQLTPSLRGFVVGVALPIPVRDRNLAAVGEARADERSARFAAELQEGATRAQARELREILQTLDAELGRFPDSLHDPETFLETLVARYDEGLEPLSGAVASITLLADTYRTWFQQLDAYFEAAFQLEALTGRRLLTP